MKLEICHETIYHYDRPVPYGLQQLRLTPKSRTNQKVVNWLIEVEGGRKELEFEDQHNNHVVLVSTEANADKIRIIARGSVDTINSNGVVGKQGGYAPLWYFLRQSALTHAGPLVQALVRDFDYAQKDPIETLHTLSQTIGNHVQYQLGSTSTATTAEGALTAQKGVCQDHAHVFLSAARLLGFPARYVSGYLMLDARVEQDATHAWAEAHVEGLGWVGFDISNGISPDERYVALATGIDFLETAPVSGVRFGNSGESLIVSLQVQQ